MRSRVAALGVAALTAVATTASRPSQALAQQPAAQQGQPAESTTHIPFGVGERMEYDVRFGHFHVGTGDMEVLPMDTVRGHQTWHTLFHLSGGYLFYKVNDRYEDWFEVGSLSSLRYHQDIDEGSYEPKRSYEIFPDRSEFVEYNKEGEAKPVQPSVRHPLDETSFLYYLRTVPLRIGLDTSFNNYFIADRNPVKFRVVGVDTIDVPAGRFAALVVKPIFQSKLFSEGGDATVWLSDDDARIMLQMKSKVRWGSLNLYLKSYRPSPSSTARLNRVSSR